MLWVGFELTILVLKRAKTFHTLDRAATMIGEKRLDFHIRFHYLEMAFPSSLHVYMSL
jgi:hypothetical protein